MSTSILLCNFSSIPLPQQHQRNSYSKYPTSNFGKVFGVKDQRSEPQTGAETDRTPDALNGLINDDFTLAIGSDMNRVATLQECARQQGSIFEHCTHSY